jgi:hypothetical protein
VDKYSFKLSDFIQEAAATSDRAFWMAMQISSRPITQARCDVLLFCQPSSIFKDLVVEDL